MRKLSLIILLSFVFGVTFYGQKFSREFGKIGQAEVDLKQYPLDKTADAVVLFDIGQSYFDLEGNKYVIGFERATRIKILTKAGIKWSEVEIPFYHEGNIFEKVFDIEAYTYNYENGKLNKTALKPNAIYDEKVNDYWSVRKFALPNVKEGSIIEYRYKISSQFMFNLRDWKFQWRIPVVYSEYEVDMIPFYEYFWLLQGAKKFDSQTSQINILTRRFGSVEFHDVVNKFVMKDVPAFKSEEFITSINDYIIKLDFQLAKINYPDGSSINVMTTWDELIKNFLKYDDFGKYVKKSAKLSAKLIDEKSLAGKSDIDKFNFILDYVKTNFNWDKTNDKLASKSPGKFVTDKYGNSADINLFTVGMLNNAGIKAWPVLSSTRDHGKIKYDYPYSRFFNYVLIAADVDGKRILSDATEPYLLNDRIPERCINDKGLIINKDSLKWISLECHFPSEMITDIEIDFTDSTLNAGITKKATEYDAQHFRNDYTDIETIKEKLNSKNYTLNDQSVSVENKDDKYKPFILKYSITTQPEIIHDKMYVPPFLNETISDNPLKQKSRIYPVDMTYPEKRSFKSTIMIPDGYQVDFLPAEQIINNQLFAMNYRIVKNNNLITISFYYYFKKPVYPAKNYSDIKFYFSEVVKKGNAKIVFSRKTSGGD